MTLWFALHCILSNEVQVQPKFLGSTKVRPCFLDKEGRQKRAVQHLQLSLIQAARLERNQIRLVEQNRLSSIQVIVGFHSIEHQDSMDTNTVPFSQHLLQVLKASRDAIDSNGHDHYWPRSFSTLFEERNIRESLENQWVDGRRRIGVMCNCRDKVHQDCMARHHRTMLEKLSYHGVLRRQ